MYNNHRYNESQYQYILLADNVTVSDTTVKEHTKALSEFVFLLDSLTKQVTNKGLSDSVQLIDWLSKNRDNETTWSD